MSETEKLSVDSLNGYKKEDLGPFVLAVSPDHLEAWIYLREPLSEPLEKEQVLYAIKNAGIVRGIQEDTIEEWLKSEDLLLVPCLAAKGDPPLDGKDGQIEILVELGRTGPRLDDDSGKVDHRELGLIHNVKKGALLARKKPPVDGVAGKDIFGKTISARKGRDFQLPAGRNCEVDPNGLAMTSAVDGCVVRSGGRLHVTEVFEVSGDVDFNTGNIKCDSSIKIHGGVTQGFTVEAGGNVEIGRIVEAATVRCEGNLFIHGGIQGHQTGIIEAKGFIQTRFIQNAIVRAGENLEVGGQIVVSDIECHGPVTVSGKNAAIVGGSIKCDSLTVDILGSEIGASTSIEVRDLKAEIRQQIANCQIEIDKNLANLTKLETAVLIFKNKIQEFAGNEEAKKKFALILNTITTLRMQTEELEKNKTNLQAEMDQIRDPFIRVNRIVYPGVRIKIGPCVQQIKTETKAVEFRMEKREIHMVGI